MKYRVGFALTTALGNKARYINLRKYVDRDHDMECIWAPIAHYLDPDPYRLFPGPIRTQLTLNHECAEILRELNNLDAVVVHAFQFFSYLSLLRHINRRPLLVWNQDYAPFPSIDMLVNYGQPIQDNLPRKVRYQLESWFTRQADLHIAFSHWVKESLIRDHYVPPEQIHVIPVGVDLELWPYRPKPPDSTERPRILFVGGDFHRKGGDLLLDVFCRHFADIADLDLVTRQAPTNLPSSVSVYTDFGPNDPRLRERYAACDVFVLPTRADMSPIVIIEAMATGRPVISTNIGGIPDLVKDGQSGFLIQSGDGTALRERLAQLLDDGSLRLQMGMVGRSLVEHSFNGETIATQMLTVLKEAIEHRRSSSTRRGSVTPTRRGGGPSVP